MTNINEKAIKLCPACAGTAYVADGKKIVCDACGFTLYFNTAAAVAALIFDAEGRLLVIRRNHEPRVGFLDLPGGFVDFGEDGEAAVRREVLEELGVGIDDVRYYKSIPNTYLYRNILYHTLDLFFTCRINGDLSSIKHNEEISEILFMYPKDISADDIAFDSMRNLVKSITTDRATPSGSRGDS